MNEEEEFDWPCNRRDAHAPHDLTLDHTAGECTRLGFLWCPGVQAHPSTMIGGNHLTERKA